MSAAAVEIRTPEGVSFSLPLAGPVTRLLAISIDGAVVIASFTAISTASSAVLPLLGEYVAAAQVLLFFGVQIGYGLLLEWLWNGRTLGKRAVGLRVVDAQGLRLTFSQVLIRNLLRAVDSLPVFYLLGGIVCILNSRLQRLGDLAAGTIVVRTRRLKLPALPPGQGSRQNSLREYPALAARLRQKLEPEQARIALEALRRRDSLGPPARLLLFAEISTQLKSLVEFPEEAILYLTDEQYVWNVVEIVFQSARHE